MATLMERLAFLQKVPTLMKATADDETPCPGYLFEEIGKISNESVGCCQCLLEYILERLQVESCHVKLKVVKILLHLCGHGPPHFLTELRRNATFIQEVTVYSGPPDPIHGNAPYQRVRAAAQELASLLFTDTVSPESVSPCKAATPSMGMGSESSPRSGMQGFGYSPRNRVSSGGTLLDKIQKVAEVMASAVLPPTEHPGIRLHDNHYRAVVVPSGAVEVAVPACAYNVPAHSQKATQRCPGQAGGGWEETDSGHSSSHNSSQENGPISRASVGGSSKSGGTDSHSGASRESGDLSERVEAMQLGDCGQEMALISSLTEGSKVFLSREESQRFLKECSTLNCEVVVELLSRKLQDPTQTVQMRALCAVACLMSSDLLSLDQIFGVTHKRLAQLSEGTSGPVANKATKLLRQFEALMGCPTRRDATLCPAAASLLLSDHPSKSPLADLLLPTPLRATATPSSPVEQESDSEQPSARGHTTPSSEPGLELNQDCCSAALEFPPARLQRELLADQQSGLGEEEGADIKDPGLGGPTDPHQSPEARSPQPKLSLFSGMELVSRGQPVRLADPAPAERDVQTGAEASADSGAGARTDPKVAAGSPLQGTQDASDLSPTGDLGHSSQLASAFSFLNL